MKFDKKYDLTVNDFNHYEDAELKGFECNDNGVIVYYTKNAQDYSFGAATMENAMKMWNTQMI